MNMAEIIMAESMTKTSNDTENTSEKPSPRLIYTPSYMINVHARSSSLPKAALSPAPSQSSTTDDRPFSPAWTLCDATPRLLLIMIAGQPHASLAKHIETIMSRVSITDIIIIGTAAHEPAIKQLKIDAYHILGRMQVQAGLQVHTPETWDEAKLDAIVKAATKTRAIIRGVLCCPEYEDASVPEKSILGLGTIELEHAMRQSTGFVHAVAKACTSHLTSRQESPRKDMTNTSLHDLRRSFFIVTTTTSESPVAALTTAALESLVSMLKATYRASGLIIGHSDTLLIPRRSSEKRSGANYGSMRPLDTGMPRGPSKNAELSPVSPIKLWNMWSRANELHI
jgi:hypothetical protein